jgi:enoyl-CoA hydratase/carnithine racemase
MRPKRFISGADIGMLSACKSPQDGEATSWHSNASLLKIDKSEKPFVCAYNGLAFGGGNELALACHARIAKKGRRVLAGQPEPNLGLIPGSGATQRLPRVVPVATANEMLRTGRPISGAEALAAGLVSEEVENEGDLVDRAVALANAMARDGFRRIDRQPLDLELPDVELGHLSTAVDEIMKKAIIDGNKLGLDQGLAFESKCFGEVCGLEDMRIGMKNFIENGPRKQAEFKHL